MGKNNFVNPNPISEMDVRAADIKVRSVLIIVRSNDIAVRLDESSTDAASGSMG